MLPKHNKYLFRISDIPSLSTSPPNQTLLCLIGRGGSVADRLMDPSSETTHATHCIQSSTSSEQLHAKKTSGRTRKKGGGGRAGGAGGENK